MKTFGTLQRVDDHWVIETLEPHVAIKLKAVFNGIKKNRPAPFNLPGTWEAANDLEWFTSRYPLAMSEADARLLKRDARKQREQQEELTTLFTETFTPRQFEINGEPRDYQSRAVELYLRTGRLVVGDEVGLGKTLIGICSFVDRRTLPALVVVQAHLCMQWKNEIAKFLGLNAHIIRQGIPYPLPAAEVYICTYSKLAGWVDIFTSKVQGRRNFLRSVIFDECQELRRTESKKYGAAAEISKACDFSLGLSATPIYNYGDEVWNVFNAVMPGKLGTFEDFSREWCGYERSVKDPKALGSYLRENHSFVRRLKSDVGRELPALNKIIHTVGHDDEAIERVEDLARQLALKVTTGQFHESGEAARELDMMMRLVTGVAKAKFVAQYVRILLENKEPVLLAGWHREVYDIWNEELKEFNPVMFTGSETPPQKEKSKQAFMLGAERGGTDLMFISNRSGVGLDGLQFRCSYVVHGELDWSPQIHEQIDGRLARDGQTKPVTSIYLISDGGSDPLLVDLLGLKASEAKGIVDPFVTSKPAQADESRIKALANYVLQRRAGAQADLLQLAG